MGNFRTCNGYNFKSLKLSVHMVDDYLSTESEINIFGGLRENAFYGRKIDDR